MRVRVGTSGWSYNEWKGSFYPDDISSDAMLAYYASRLGTVEVNNTFYRLPRKEVLAGWAEQVPDDFSFVIKASQKITHHAKLGTGAADPLRYLLGCCEALGPKLGPLLFQTPPWLKKDVPLLQDFLALLPRGTRGAFEFRSTSWFDDAVYDALRAGNHALALADTGEADKDPPFMPTASWGYARLRRVAYEEGLLAQWAERLTSSPWDEIYVFFKHEDEGTGPRLARQFLALTGG